jgi:hypothetical protein
MSAPEWAICIVFMGAVSIQPVRGQAVISARSGLVHYFEGAVYVADRPLESHLGKYVSIPEGGELRTEHGRAEVLLTPGVFLRVGENTTIRMISTALADTKVELLAGSAILDSLDAGAGRLCTLIYKSWTLTESQKGVYRLDSDPPRVVVREGEVDVVANSGSSAVSVEGGMEMPFATVLAPAKLSDDARDALNDWADGRAQSIAADNEVAANIQDPGTMPASDLLPDSFTYFPMLGVPSYTASLSGVGSFGLYGGSSAHQPGFYSIYLPGYSRPPSFLGLRGIGGLGSLGGFGLPHSLTPPSRVISPISPMRSPFTHPSPVHPAPHGGMHIGGHR